MEPYRYTDAGGDSLEIASPVDCDAAVLSGAAEVCVDPLDIPEVTAAMYRACGQEPPVMLGRPDLNAMRDADGWVSIRCLRLRRATGGGVSFAIGGSMETITEAQARQCAAVTAALADKRDLEDDDVFELAAVLAQHPSATFPELARAVLADGRFGRLEARGA